jgi:hypothetical protein
MKIKSFGCSFTYGSELILSDTDTKQLTPLHASWPLLIAKHYQLEFENFSLPGIGNLRILEQILAQSELVDPAVFLINWTWLDRFDFIKFPDEAWETLRPGGSTELHSLYYKHFYQQYHSMLINASYISTAINVLNSKNINFCMTLMDTTLFDPIDPDWQDPYALRTLQRIIKPHITWFDGLDFLSWSQKNKYSISKNWHPLEQAHCAAADYMIKLFDKQKTNALVQQVRV